MTTECPNCERHFSGPTCPLCGWVLASLATVGSGIPAIQMAKACPFDRALLHADGYCPRAEGYPIGTPCPFACPVCRQPLDWSGGCLSCHGCTTGKREDWTFPGDGYYTHEVDGTRIGDGHHWVKGQQGPRPAVSPAEHVANMRRVMAKLGTAHAVPTTGTGA